jgi:hypothetical protein
MNALNQWYQDEDVDEEPQYQVHVRREAVTTSKLKRQSFQNKSRNNSVNGIHRRRNKRFAW